MVAIFIILKSYVDKLCFPFYYERERISGNVFAFFNFKNMTDELKNNNVDPACGPVGSLRPSRGSTLRKFVDL